MKQRGGGPKRVPEDGGEVREDFSLLGKLQQRSLPRL
eukprot:CAMPEP_0173380908 /NCGR_PEP_ID=MMETSP1356-20130122/3468_1 /TAXON_ID=77927 ORGANISM="Hemiselmis virescens, Strain PCC157" /NCGR_SAMPLE_ID=MMETSP1356 /ASSEMBLY_ACC=CAM_ASM_000847 /LENGTH=36 /DNA_ID= /DNA_START= /DNA_END= /DNA_ORIENTATION=